MLGWLSGTILATYQRGNRHLLVLRCGSVGYEINVTQRDWNHIAQHEECDYWIHQVSQNDDTILYGFTSLNTRELFRTLISVNGVGPQVGLALLQECSVEDLVEAIIDGDLSLLSQAQGVGRRTAERITVELRSSLESQRASFQQSDPGKGQEPKDEGSGPDSVPGDLVNTLNVLGYESSEIRAAIRAVKQTLPPGSGEEVWLRACLKQLSVQ
jgi:Holliday junction DNA helicase RuvA